MAEPHGPAPRLWHIPTAGRHADATHSRVLVGRQGIFRDDFELVAYELLFRAPGRLGLRIDLWNQRQQDRATEHVIAAAFLPGAPIGSGRRVSINFTRSYLVSHDDLHCDPQEVIVEVVESAFADDALRDRVAALKSDGYSIALDDFIGTKSQLSLIEHAAFVKIDYRDLQARGEELVSLAQSSGAALVAERIETRSALKECVDLGFEYFQGHAFEPAVLVDRGHAPLSGDADVAI